MLTKFDKESKALKTELLKSCWFMRGGVSYDDAMVMSFEDREICHEIIKDNLETTKESGLPFF
jgi:hypothetical protein